MSEHGEVISNQEDYLVILLEFWDMKPAVQIWRDEMSLEFATMKLNVYWSKYQSHFWPKAYE